MSKIRRLASDDPNFSADLDGLLRVDEQDRDDVVGVVQQIIDDIRERGDQALIEYTNRFDRRDVDSVAALEQGKEALAAATDRIDPLVRDALQSSIDRVTEYHREQKRVSGDQVDWSFEDEDGNQLGQMVRGMERVGLYVPGGKASYPSSVIMTAIPARVAEVGEIILAVPAPDGEISDVLLAAAHLCEIDRVLTIGGAQAIAALAYGTASIPGVDKIVGPGNIYVATAKRLVFGQVGIDMIAGPSEVVIVADASADPEWLVMDMFAQAEHDELAQSILISTDDDLLDRVDRAIDDTLASMSRASIIEASIAHRGALVHVPDIEAAAAVVNRIAPEHLELAIADPDAMLPLVKHAGAIFMGSFSPEAIGDYCAGPSHVLPTGGTARFASPLGIHDFQVRSSLIRCSAKGAVMLGRNAAILATEEGLEAHARSADLRVRG